jgi:hypothetical protein
MIPIPYADTGSEALRAWMRRYKARFKEEADLGAAFGYQQILLFAEGLKNAGRELNVSTLAQGILNIRNYTDLFEAVPFTYSPNNRLGAHAAFIFQVQQGRWKKAGTMITPDIHPLVVHYASPHTGYGPITAGAEGLSYLTLRAVGDKGAWYLPEQRDQLQLRIPKKVIHAAPAARTEQAELAALDCAARRQPRHPGLVDRGHRGREVLDEGIQRPQDPRHR